MRHGQILSAKEVYGQLAEKSSQVARYVKESDALYERHAPVAEPDRWVEESTRQGADQRLLSAMFHSMIQTLESTSKEIDSKPSVFRNNFEEMFGGTPIGESLMSALKESTAGSDIAAYRFFTLGIVREVWPMLVPLQMAIGLVPMAGPSGNIHFLKTYGDDAGTYSAAWRLRNQVDPEWHRYATYGTDPKDVSLTITGTTLTVQDYALIAKMDLSALQDASAQYGIDLVAELKRVMAMYVARAKIAQARNDLLGSASGGSATWSTTAGSPYTLDSFGPREHKRTLLDKIGVVEQSIQSIRYAPLGFVWVSLDVARYLNESNGYHVRSNGDQQMKIGKTLAYQGDANGAVVLVDPDAAAGTCLCGVSPGAGLTNLSYVQGVYVPIAWVPTVGGGTFTDPKELQPRMSAVTRYARKLIDGGCLGKIIIS